MAKSASSFSRSGLSDWIIQRVSAVYLGLYLVALVGWMVCSGPVSFQAWQELFACTAVRIASLLALIAMAAHAWIGLWTISTDYLNQRTITKFFLPAALANPVRWAFQLFYGVALFVYVVWGIQILWG